MIPRERVMPVASPTLYSTNERTTMADRSLTPRGALPRRWITRAGLAVLVALATATSGCNLLEPPAEDSPVLAFVNGRPITLDEFDFRWEKLSDPAKARYQGNGGRHKFLDDLIDHQLLIQEARKLGLDRSPEILEDTRRHKENLLRDKVMNQAVQGRAEVDKKELEAYYALHGAALPAPDEIEIAQILTNNRYAAKDIRRMLREGASFAPVARQFSTDQRTRGKGGAVGLYQKGSAPPEVEEVIYKLRRGRISEPIRTESGFYIVKVTSRKPGDREAVLDARERLTQEFRAEKRQELIRSYLANLKAAASIRIADASKYVTHQATSLSDTVQP